jgi:hypothetical protein
LIQIKALESIHLLLLETILIFFLNQQQNDLSFKMSGKEDYLSVFNGQFNLFALIYWFENLPPLQNALNDYKVLFQLLSSKIRNIDTNAPLLLLQKIKPSEMLIF